MADPRSPLLRTLSERGFIHQATDIEGLDALVSAGPVSAYIGFDLTAPSLHVGSLIQLMALRHLKTHGHKPIVLFGDATTRVGDPSDKNGLRPVLSEDDIETNRVGIVQVVDRILGNVRHVHNSEWLGEMRFMDFLTGPARGFTLNRMLTLDIVARRLEAGLPMTVMEMLYSMLQGMDFAHLSKKLGVRLQIGGSDQWTNILAGMEIARRESGTDLFGLTTPLMTDEQGRKMGKTADGKAVWLSPDLVSSHDLWQFWRNVPDAKVPQFLGLFTELPMDEVRRLSALGGSEINEAKKVLATQVVGIAHGADHARKAELSANSLFAGNGEGGDVPTLKLAEPDRLLSLADIVVRAALAESKGAARRLAQQGGLRVDGEAVEDAGVLAGSVLTRTCILSAGRKRRVRVELA